MVDLALPTGDGVYGADHPDGPGVTITERRGLNIVHLAGNVDDAEFPTAARHALGLPLPLSAGETRDGRGVRVLWLAPDRWLVVSTEPVDVSALAGMAAINDVGQGRIVLRLEGARVRELLAKGCPVDLHPGIFTVGHCASTLLGKLTVIIDAVTEDAIDLYVTRSYDLFVREWLFRAAQEFGVRLTNT